MRVVHWSMTTSLLCLFDMFFHLLSGAGCPF
jgi:hypothetical protein